VPLRYLIGPVSASWKKEYLPSSDGLCFDQQPAADLIIEEADTWERFQARWPAGFAPEVLFLYLPYRHIPSFLWSSPLPIVALAGDWNLQWHACRSARPRRRSRN
jgi:hypothetical protein